MRGFAILRAVGKKLLIVAVVVLLSAVILWKVKTRRMTETKVVTPAPEVVITTSPVVAATTPRLPPVASTKGGPPSVAVTPPPPPPLPPPTPPVIEIPAPAGQEGMFRQLIPRGISVVRMSFSQEIMAPGTLFSFDINGTGFDENFYRMITVDADALDIQVKNLELVTANQIRGQMDVGTAALTTWVKPLIYIRGKPVFRAPHPFGVVRKGEVLDIELTKIDESGQWGEFRVITNLDSKLYGKFNLSPTTQRLEVGNTKPQYPFYVLGAIQIGERLATGSYGLIATMNGREVFRKQPLVDVVKPNVGRSGSIDDIQSISTAHRPGDMATFIIRGSGFTPKDPASLALRVTPVAMETSTITFMSGGRLQAMIRIPDAAPAGIYGMSVESGGKTLFIKKQVFGIVPPNWISGIKLQGELKPGGSTVLLLNGRDLTEEFAQTLRLDVDDAGLILSPLQRRDASTLVADIKAAETLAPGDYLIHVYIGDQEKKLPGGNLIKVTP